jgi:hypothetical protein
VRTPLGPVAFLALSDRRVLSARRALSARRVLSARRALSGRCVVSLGVESLAVSVRWTAA